MGTPRHQNQSGEPDEESSHDELTSSNARLRVLAELSRQFSTSIDSPALLAVIVRAIAEQIGDGCSIVLFDEKGEGLARAASAHRDPALDAAFKAFFDGVTIPKDLAKSVVATVARTGTPAYAPDVPPESLVDRATDALKPLVRQLNIHSLLAVPVRGRESIVGTLSLLRSRPDCSYTRDDLVLLEDVADRAGLAIQNADLLELARARSAALAEANATLRQHAALLEGISEAVVSLDAVLRVRTWNRGAEEVFGWKFEEVLGRPLAELIGVVDVDPSREQILRQLQDAGVWAGERQQRRKDGSVVNVLLSASALTDEAGKLAGIMLIGRDLTRQQESESAIRQLASIVESSTDAILSGTLEGIVRTWNRGAQQLLGYEASEIIGRSIDCLVPEEKREEQRQIGAQIYRREHPPPFETVLLRKDGSRVDVSVTLSPILTREGTTIGVSSIVRDITKHRRLEQQVMLSERLASVGMLAAGVAHEINNPLAYVRGNLELVLRELKQSSSAALALASGEFVQLIDGARDGADRIARIVQGLKTFSRAEHAPYSVLALQSVLEAAVSLTQNELRHSARLVRDYANTPPILGDEGRLVQVFVNLLVNAAHALKETEAHTGEIHLILHTDEQGRAVAEVRDTGNGIPESSRQHIFDAFFTTKPVGTGTGLGLSISHSIIEAHGGDISFESELGAGTTFRVTLPAPRAKAVSEKPPAAIEQEIRSARRAKILVVDDEPMIVRYLMVVLSTDHDVTTCTSAEQAMDVLRKGERFDAILCDLMMPGLTGMDLHAELKRLDPEQAERMIFITGGAFTAASRQFLETVANRRLDKPFTTAKVLELSRALAR